VLEDTKTGAIAGARMPCKRKSCRDCGPLERQRIIQHFLVLMDGHQMRRRRLEPAARRAAVAKLRRGGHQWVPVPAPDGSLILYATGGDGELVSDLEATFTADVMAAPAGRSIVGCRQWSRQPVAIRGEGRWKLLGMAKVPLARLIQVALDLDMYRGQVEPRALPADWAEAHLLERPADELTWRRFKRWVGLHWPERQRRRVAA
jgi:hypothetical protein